MQTSRPASTSTRQPVSPLPRQVNTQTKVLDSTHGKILCVADIRGRLSALNDMARDVNAACILHTGDFGFFESNSLERINDRTLRHLTMYTPLIPEAQRAHLLGKDNTPQDIRSTVDISLLSEFPLLLSGQIKLQVPVYTVWGACEDVFVLEKFRQGTYNIENLHILDEATTRCIDMGGIKLRLFGLGGALVLHKLFDNGEGRATIAGGQGTMWTTALQIGELVDTAQRVYDPSETRLLVTHASPGREGIMAQLALVLQADLTLSAGLHFRYATSYNEFSVQGDFEGFRHKLALGKEGFDKIWETVRVQVEAVIDDNQRVLLDKALSVVGRLPPSQPSSGPGAAATGDEPAWKNCWNWNLCDAAYGKLVLDIEEGRISAELKSEGFNFAYRRTPAIIPTPNSTDVVLPNTNQPQTKHATPISQADRPPSANPSHAKANSNASQPLSPAPATPSGKGSPVPKVNGANASTDKVERDKAKKKEKKERKEREKAEREKSDKEKEKNNDAASTPKSSSTPVMSESATTPAPPDFSATNISDSAGPKSPVTDGGSTGVRTPRSGRPQRHPWTLFIRMPSHMSVGDADVKEFFGETKDKIMKINWPTLYPGRAKIAYIEFEDEPAMKAGLESHAEKIKDVVIEVKQATERESRGEPPFRGGSRGRGRGGYAARGFAAAGLTRGGGRRGSGDANETPKPTAGASNGGGDAAPGQTKDR